MTIAGAHAPTTGKFRAGTLEIRMGEAEPGEDRGGAGGRGMRGDVREASVQLGDAVGIGGGFRLREQRGALAVGGEHEIDERLGPVRRLLRQSADATARRPADAPGLGGEFARDHPEQGGLSRAVAADQTGPRAVGNLRRGVFDEQAAGHAD